MAIIRSHSGRVLLDTARAMIIVGEWLDGHEFHFATWDVAARYFCPVRETWIPCYSLMKTTARNDYHRSFYAYFCRYVPNQVHVTQLGQAMDYFFTPSLTGCSIGMSQPDGVGRFWIGHANARDAQGMIEDAPVATNRLIQQAEQTQMLGGTNRGLNSIYHPPDYGQPLDSQYLMTTLIGFRDRATGRWSFIRQTIDQAGEFQNA